MLPPFEAGDLLAVMTAGAYGAVMASTYNTRPLVPEVMVNGAQFAVVRPRVEVDDKSVRGILEPKLEHDAVLGIIYGEALQRAAERLDCGVR